MFCTPAPARVRCWVQNTSRIQNESKDRLTPHGLLLVSTGPPSEEYIAKIAKPTVQQAVRTITANYVRRPLRDLPYFQGVAPVAIDLLEKILVYEPAQRMSAAEALQHPFFEQFHDPEDEPIGIEPFDDSFENLDLSAEQWAQKCADEVVFFNGKYGSASTHAGPNGLAALARAAAARDAQLAQPPVNITFQMAENPDAIHTVAVMPTMDHTAIKKLLMGAAGLAKQGITLDRVSMYFNQKRISCTYDHFHFIPQDTTSTPSLVLHTNIAPWQRALERADQIKYHWWLSALLVLRKIGNDARVGGHRAVYRTIQLSNPDFMRDVWHNQWASGPCKDMLESAGWVLDVNADSWTLPSGQEADRLYTMVTREFHRILAIDHLMFIPTDDVFKPVRGPVVWNQITDSLMGAVLCDRWKLDKYIQSGTFGHGWGAVDVQTGRRVFVKTFRCNADRNPKSRGNLFGREDSARKEMEVMLHPLFTEASSHDAVVTNVLCYGTVHHT